MVWTEITDPKYRRDELRYASGMSYLDRRRLTGDCQTMNAAMRDILSVWGPSQILLQTGATPVSCAFHFGNFASFACWRPPRN
jgi:hypothetical protein